jgi:uncharacterized protein YjbI with pentapeptide repeats/beta-lactamase regulating signal transducer with metallopeptidase domain
VNWHQGFVTIASGVAAMALNALWQDALLVLCVWLLLRAWPKINAATRYLVWSATLAAAFIIPVATTWAFFAPPQTLSIARATAAAPVAASHAVAAGGPQRVTPSSPTPSRAPARLPDRLHLTLPVPVAVGVFALWLLLAAYALARLIVGLVRLEQLKRDALPLPVEYRDAMPQWLSANKGARDVRLCVSDETDVPIAVGLFDAMILIPRSLLDRLSEPEVDQICLHELAHLRRADDWTNGVQRVVSALLGWNPAAQFVGQQLDLEREVACDDWVLSFIGKVRPYALCLTKMAESASWPRHPIPAPGVFATRKHISLRIERLLGAGRNIATNLAIAPAAAAVAVVGAIALVIAVVAPSIAAPCVGTAITSASTKAASPTTAVAAVHPTPEATSAPAEQATPQELSVPARQVTVPATHVSVPATHVEVPATHVDVPAVHVNVPAVHVNVPGANVSVPATHVDIPQIDVHLPSMKNFHDQISTQIDRAMASADASARNAQSWSRVAQAGPSIQSDRGCSKCDFSGVDWQGRDLHGVSYNGVDFSNANLARVNFAGGSFASVDFTDANLAGVSFRNARLSNCDFSNANLSGADFSGAQITHCDFSGRPNLHGVVFRNARIAGSDFTEATLAGIDFTGASLIGCDLDGVDLTHVDFSKARVTESIPSRDNSPP